MLLKNLEFLYNDATNKLIALGYDEGVALMAILRNGHCYGGMDVLTNILHNSLAYLNGRSSSVGKEDEPEPSFADLTAATSLSLIKALKSKMSDILSSPSPSPSPSSPSSSRSAKIRLNQVTTKSGSLPCDVGCGVFKSTIFFGGSLEMEKTDFASYDGPPLSKRMFYVDEGTMELPSTDYLSPVFTIPDTHTFLDLGDQRVGLVLTKDDNEMLKFLVATFQYKISPFSYQCLSEPVELEYDVLVHPPRTRMVDLLGAFVL
ncbi:hypothetical protein OROGR_020052 [Orobanche gracilis]